MPRTFSGFVPPLLAALALLSPGKAFAGPPEAPSGRMVVDEVADGLRRYRKATTPESRIRWLEKLAPTHDPRVAVALVDAITGDTTLQAITLLIDHRYSGHTKRTGTPRNANAGPDEIDRLEAWWKANEADLRRRAKQLPR